MQSKTSAFFLLLVATLWGQSALAEVEVRKIEQKLAAGSARKIIVDLTVGSVKVEGVGGKNIEIEARFECTREDLDACKERAQKLYISPRNYGDRIDIRLKGTPKARLLGIKSHLVLRVPDDLPLQIDARSADVTVEGLHAGLEINSGEGNVSILHSARRVGMVTVKTGVGKVDLWVDDSHVEGTGFPRALNWHGTGEARIDVDLGKGDVNIQLK